MRYVNRAGSIALRVDCITMALALAMGVIVTYLPPGDKYHLAYRRPLAIGEFQFTYWVGGLIPRSNDFVSIYLLGGPSQISN